MLPPVGLVDECQGILKKKKPKKKTQVLTVDKQTNKTKKLQQEEQNSLEVRKFQAHVLWITSHLGTKTLNPRFFTNVILNHTVRVLWYSLTQLK